MEMITVSAKTVDDAITKALIQLETTSDKLEYEVVEKGSSGFLGIGAKPAIIRARKKEEEPVEVPAPEVKAEKTERPAKPAKPVKSAKTEMAKSESRSFEKSAPAKKETPAAVIDDPETEEKIKKFLGQVFESMSLEVTVDVTVTEEEIGVNLSGDDMGILIGKRGQTLDSLQYLVSLVVNKGRDGYIRVKLDTENYRERRKETLETLAKNIAYKVKRTKRPVSLEPMNPYERRIIHSALQNDRYVVTRSDGEEPFRHVVIFLKREGGRRERREN